jgi:methanol:N,N-dimethyl-4-nitrosoaniline oxidoreductase
MNMVWAEYIATQAFSSGMLGILHSVSHAICSIYDIHHGLNCGVGLPRIIDYNRPARYERMRNVAEAMGVDTKNLTNNEAADRAIEASIRLVKDLDVRDKLAGTAAINYPKSRVAGNEGAGGPEDNWYRHNQPSEIDDTYLDYMVNHMMMDLCNAGNPRDVTPEACRELLLDIIYDDFALHTRMSRLPEEDRMAGATGPRTVTGEPRTNPPAAPIYGPEVLGAEGGYGG